jgi:hypothetical protein
MFGFRNWRLRWKRKTERNGDTWKRASPFRPEAETDRCVDPWKDWPKWEPVHPDDIGQPAPDPRFVAHRIFRVPVIE